MSIYRVHVLKSITGSPTSHKSLPSLDRQISNPYTEADFGSECVSENRRNAKNAPKPSYLDPNKRIWPRRAFHEKTKKAIYFA